MPNQWTDPGPGGAVDPQIVRGDIPEPQHFGGAPKKPAIYGRHRELARAFPPVLEAGELHGGWVLCARQNTRGHGPKERAERIMRDRRRLDGWLRRTFPLERYQISVRTLEDMTKELYMRWIGDVTPEQHAIDVKERRRRYEVLLAQREAARTRRALKNRGQPKPQR